MYCAESGTFGAGGDLAARDITPPGVGVLDDTVDGLGEIALFDVCFCGKERAAARTAQIDFPKRIASGYDWPMTLRLHTYLTGLNRTGQCTQRRRSWRLYSRSAGEYA